MQEAHRRREIAERSVAIHVEEVQRTSADRSQMAQLELQFAAQVEALSASDAIEFLTQRNAFLAHQLRVRGEDPRRDKLGRRELLRGLAEMSARN